MVYDPYLNRGHVPVLLKETIASLKPSKGDVAVDLTLGRGGHALEIGKIIESTKENPRLYGIDLDYENIEFAKKIINENNVHISTHHGSFIEWSRTLEDKNQTADVLFADLGVCSTHLDCPSKGFSFMSDGPLDMRLNQKQSRTAADILKEYSVEEIKNMITDFGEEPLARRIAEKIGQTRLFEPILRTSQLAKIVEEAYGTRAKKSKRHPSTRTFMALRIAVNDELTALQVLLNDIFTHARRKKGALAPNARIGFITFHSLEDRIVKRSFREFQKSGLGLASSKIITATKEETKVNPRATSAKLRSFIFKGIKN